MRQPPPSREARFRELYAATYDPVLRFAQRRADPHEAQDITADTFLVAWRRLDDVPTRPEERLPWLYAVARNCLLNQRRADHRRDALTIRIADAIPAPGDRPLDADAIATRLDLTRAWQRLQPGEQEVLALTLWEDLTSPQAGQVLGISGAAYRVRLARARRALRGHLDLIVPAAPPVGARLQESQS